MKKSKKKKNVVPRGQAQISLKFRYRFFLNLFPWQNLHSNKLFINLQDKEIVPENYGRLSKITKPSIIDQTKPKAANPAPNMKGI